MSIEIAKEFLARLATDGAAAKNAQGLTGPALVSLAQQMGYSFTETDLQQAMAGAPDPAELSTEDLERVSGGMAARPYLRVGAPQPNELISGNLDRLSGGMATPRSYLR